MFLSHGDCLEDAQWLAAKIKEELHWQPCHSTIQEIVTTAWRWHEGHPNGYEE